jgi:hypothetical protein
MRWRDRFLFVAEAIYKSQAETGKNFCPNDIYRNFICNWMNCMEAYVMFINNNKNIYKNINKNQKILVTTTQSSNMNNFSVENDKNNKNEHSSFFAQFPTEKIFEHWNSCNTLLEIAQKLGFNDNRGLSHTDYIYIFKNPLKIVKFGILKSFLLTETKKKKDLSMLEIFLLNS